MQLETTKAVGRGVQAPLELGKMVVMDILAPLKVVAVVVVALMVGHQLLAPLAARQPGARAGKALVDRVLAQDQMVLAPQ
jgi:hypothetical protein